MHTYTILYLSHSMSAGVHGVEHIWHRASSAARGATCIHSHMPLHVGCHTSQCSTANLPTNIMDFRGFDSSMILILRGGIPRPIGNFPESLTQAM